MRSAQTYGLFRQPVYRTPLLATYMAAELTIATVFCLSDIPGLEYAFNLTELPLKYRAQVFLLASLYAACAICYERFCVPHVSDDEGELGVVDVCVAAGFGRRLT